MKRQSFDSADALWVWTLRHIMEMGSDLDSRAGGCQEVVGYQAILEDPRKNFVTAPERKLSPSYAAAELLWYLSGKGDVEMLLPYAPSYAQFAQPGGWANGAYGARWWGNPGFWQRRNDRGMQLRSQLDAAIALLRKSPNTRQCLVTMWDSGDVVDAIFGDMKDVPCTVCLQFLLRDGKLWCVCFMRSNDAWLGLPYDVFCFTTVQMLVARAIGVEPGPYVHTVGSMHLYLKNSGKASAAVKWSSPSFCEPWNFAISPEAAESLLRGDSMAHAIEHDVRATLRELGPIQHAMGVELDLVMACASKLRPALVEKERLSHPGFKLCL